MDLLPKSGPKFNDLFHLGEILAILNWSKIVSICAYKNELPVFYTLISKIVNQTKKNVSLVLGLSNSVRLLS